jgi:hypothetical protein
MKAVVVFESLWGNTAAIARAIAEGIGHGAHALSTAEAVGASIVEADLIVAGAPLLGFNLPDEKMRESIRTNPFRAPAPPNLAHPSVRSWLTELPQGNGHSAAFETRLWWSPGGATGAILRGLEEAGYSPIVKGQRFIVTGKYGPLRSGELERARQWGTELARIINQPDNSRS